MHSVSGIITLNKPYYYYRDLQPGGKEIEGGGRGGGEGEGGGEK